MNLSELSEIPARSGMSLHTFGSVNGGPVSMLDILKQLRREKGVTQQQLADHIGVTQQAVNLYEHTDTQPDFITLRRMADFFGVSCDFLIRHATSDYRDPFVQEPSERYAKDEEEMAFLRKHRQLADDQRQAINLTMDSFLKIQK